MSYILENTKAKILPPDKGMEYIRTCNLCRKEFNAGNLTIYRLHKDSIYRFDNYKETNFYVCFCDECMEKINIKREW